MLYRALAILAVFMSTAFAQNTYDINSSGSAATNTSIGGGQSNLLGTNIGQQQNNSTTNINGGYGTSTTNVPSSTTAKITNVPTMYAPGLTAAGSDVCLGSVSGSGSILGFGISGGKTYIDENCVMLKNSQRMAALGFSNAAVVMMMANSDVASAIRTSSPAVYLQVAKDRLANLQAEKEYLIEVGDSTSDVEERISKANKEVRVMALRVKASPGIPEKAVEIPATISNGSAKTANDPREILQK